jgi:hypothetical protein
MASLTTQIIDSVNQANKANKIREQEIRDLFKDILSRYGEGGTFGAGYEAQLGRQKVKDVAFGMQNLVSSGMSNTTQPAGIGKKWEEEIGAPERLKLEDLRMDRLSQAQQDYGSFIERISDQAPDMSLISQLLAQGGGTSTNRAVVSNPSSWAKPSWEQGAYAEIPQMSSNYYAAPINENTRSGGGWNSPSTPSTSSEQIIMSDPLSPYLYGAGGSIKGVYQSATEKEKSYADQYIRNSQGKIIGKR